MVYPVHRILNNATAGSASGTSMDDPLQHLVACHERIEERLQTLERVVPALRAPAEEKRKEAREALAHALDFLKTMGNLHTQDEEESLFPRLRPRLKDDPFGLGELIALLESQHREKEAVYAELVARVIALPPLPEPPGIEQVNQVEALITQLTGLYRPHIMIENERLIPLSAEHLEKSDLEEMRREMRARRGL